ncbi:unnamed protein product [Cylicocyclus nassatus]|uniref:Uncharacterized protein n=1 Tax=Cylicocyclus nassatus TaxID=53992 RepID=A0AA36DJZ6_CYLNA|nr:unnamed protein product [Cylicocyclus nassatus]
MRIMIAVLLPVIMSSALSPLYFRLSHEAQIILLDFFIEKTIVLFTYNENLEKEAFYYAENRFYVVPPTKVHEIAFFDHTGKPVDDVFITQSVVKFWENETFHFGTDWQDLPESLVTFLINFVLDGVGLYAEELLMSASECARQSNRFWLGLGNNDEARTKMFDRLSEARMKLCGLARVAIGRALGDLRAYHFDAEKEMLSPPSNKGQPTGWDIAVNGAFDSKGFKEICKVLAMETKTKLCIYTEVMHRSEAG